jgi:transcriptional regulator with XRE-family HTH domain
VEGGEMIKMSVVSNFYEACREAREKAGLTLLQAEMRINSLTTKDKQICTERSLVRWEQGQGLPKIEAVKAMSIVYKRPDLVIQRLDVIEFEKRKKPALQSGLVN